MVAIKQYQSQRSISRVGTDYYTTKANPDAMGASMARATAKLGESMTAFGSGMSELGEKIQSTNALALANYIDQLEKDYLNDPNKGYLSKLGKDAMEDPNDPSKGSMAVLRNFDEMINKKQQELGLTYGSGQRMADLVRTKKMDVIYRSATSHELEQAQKYHAATLEEGQALAIQKGILHRNNPDDIKTALNNGKTLIMYKANDLHWDNDTTRIQLAQYESNFHGAVLNAYLQEDSLKATEYYEQNKDKLLPDAQAKYLGKVKTNERNYLARTQADRLFNLYPDDEAAAYKELEKIKDPLEREATETRLNAKYNNKNRIETAEQNKLLEGMYEDVANCIKTGQVPSEDLIPTELNGENYLKARSYIDQISKKGDISTDNEAYLELYEMSVTNAQEFANLNLIAYRGELSNADYKAFQKRQIDIKNMTPTQLEDQDAQVKAGLKALGYSYSKNGELKTNLVGEHTEKKAAGYKNTLNAYIRELELKKGKNLSREEIAEAQREFTASYEESSDEYLKGMNTKVGFMRNLLNDFAQAEKEKGRPLTTDEKDKIVAQRVSKQVQSDNNNLSRSTSTSQTGNIWQGHRITSPYGKRKAPKAGASTDHKGIDLAYKTNERFNAFASGTVTKVGFDKNGWGNYVEITSGDGTVHRYAHANSISVKKGDTVKAGTQIGRAGSTGNSTGTHLHYEKIVNGKSVDPLKRSTNTKQIVMKDAKGNRALVEVDASGRPIKVIKEL